MATTGLSPVVSEINGDFSPRSQTALCNLHRAVFLELGISVLGQKLELWCYRDEKYVWWYLLPSGYNTVHERDEQMDGRTDTGRQQRPR